MVGYFDGWTTTRRPRHTVTTSWMVSCIFRTQNPSVVLYPLHLKLYAPTAIRGCLLQKYYHDHPTAGHFGESGHRLFWPNLASDAKPSVALYAVCQVSKPSQRKPAGLMVPIHPQRLALKARMLTSTFSHSILGPQLHLERALPT